MTEIKQGEERRSLENVYKIPQKHQDDLRFVTFNVCGIKNVLNYMPWCENKTFEHMFELLKADVVCFQETKIQTKDLTSQMAMIAGYDSYFTFPVHKKGYSGVALYVRQEVPVLKAEQGITGWLESSDIKGKTYRELDKTLVIGGYPENIDQQTGLEIDSEGRALLLDLGPCVVIGLYCPANSSGDRDSYRTAFLDTLDFRIRKLAIEEKRDVVVMGDLNIARDLIDSAEAKQERIKEKKIVAETDPDKFFYINHKSILEWHTSSHARRLFQTWLREPQLEMIDTCREMFPKRLDMYTCWNQKIGARQSNYGSRVDYIIITKGIKCMNADILPLLLGSDHCPVFADLRLHQPNDSALIGTKIIANLKRPRLCSSYMSRFGKNQKIRDFFFPTAAASSAKSKQPSSTQSSQSVDDNAPSKKRKPNPKQISIKSFFGKPSGQSEESNSDQIDYVSNNLNSDNESYDPLKQYGMQGDEIILANSANNDVTAWQSLFSPIKPPLCDKHSEPCRMMITKKKGINKGRAFWVCSR